MESVLIPLVVVTFMSAALLRQQDPKTLRMPWVTLGLFVLTLGVGSFAIFDDTLLDAIRRDGDRLATGEWWRLFTPLVGQDGGLSGLIFNLVVLLAFGAVVENVLGWRVLLIAYLTAGLLSEVAAYTVMQDQGFAGNSVANFGLAGLLCVTAVFSSTPARFTGIVGLGLGVVMLALWDLHAIGFFVGAVVGLARWGLQRLKDRPRISARSAAPGSPGESSAGS